MNIKVLLEVLLFGIMNSWFLACERQDKHLWSLSNISSLAFLQTLLSEEKINLILLVFAFSVNIFLQSKYLMHSLYAHLEV